MKKFSVVVILIVLTGLTIACAPVERQAYNTFVAGKAYLDSQKAQHPECANGNKDGICGFLFRATAAKDFLIDAAEVYCSGPNFESGGECDAPKKGTPGYDQAVAKLNAAIAGFNQAQSDLKKAVK